MRPGPSLPSRTGVSGRLGGTRGHRCTGPQSGGSQRLGGTATAIGGNTKSQFDRLGGFDTAIGGNTKPQFG